jgi:putative metallohydrolase (TIGR04338 family)
MMRDAQRQKVYDSEFEVRHAVKGRDFVSHAAIQDYVNRVLASAWLRGQFPDAPEFVSVTVGAVNQRSKAWKSRRVVRISRHPAHMNEEVVFHELSHILAPDGVRHNWEFCDVLLKLIRHYIGVKESDELKLAFKKHKVRFRPKKQVAWTGKMPAGYLAMRFKKLYQQGMTPHNIAMELKITDAEANQLHQSLMQKAALK